MVRKIKWTLRALTDLQEIYSFIARDSSRYARLQIERIQKTVFSLTDFPLLGHIVPEFPSLPYREILVGNYRVIYRVVEEPNLILIMAVIHGHQLLRGPLN